MADCIVDTSVAVKWVMTEPDSADAMRVMGDVIASGSTLHLLDIALVEAANVIWVHAHRGKHSAQDATRILQAFRQCPPRIHPAVPFLDDAFDLALQYDIAVYDACFVAAVQRMGCLGVTADHPLIRKVGAAFPAIKLLKNW
jgi:predicted nucleic acid-binding protein